MWTSPKRMNPCQPRLCDLGWCRRMFWKPPKPTSRAFRSGVMKTASILCWSACNGRGDQLDLERLDVIISAQSMVTLHRADIGFLRAVKREYLTDFVRHAASPSFLLYELWDHLLDNFVAVQKALEDRVVGIQRALAGNPDESIFRDSSELASQLLQYRKVVLPARTVLTDLSLRKSAFVSEASQAFLSNMAGTVERILQDILVDRDILSDSSTTICRWWRTKPIAS